MIKEQIKTGNTVPLTDEKMRRFILSISQAVELVLKTVILSQGGEIFVLKMPVVRIKDLIDVIIEDYILKIGKDPSSIKIEIIGPRPGEKIQEELISSIEFSTCYETKDMYCIYPFDYFGHETISESKIFNGIKIIIDDNFQYSTKNTTPLSKGEIRTLIKDLNLI